MTSYSFINRINLNFYKNLMHLNRSMIPEEKHRQEHTKYMESVFQTSRSVKYYIRFHFNFQFPFLSIFMFQSPSFDFQVPISISSYFCIISISIFHVIFSVANSFHHFPIPVVSSFYHFQIPIPWGQLLLPLYKFQSRSTQISADGQWLAPLTASCESRQNSPAEKRRLEAKSAAAAAETFIRLKVGGQP